MFAVAAKDAASAYNDLLGRADHPFLAQTLRPRIQPLFLRLAPKRSTGQFKPDNKRGLAFSLRNRVML
jgi:hypothetical protein